MVDNTRHTARMKVRQPLVSETTREVVYPVLKETAELGRRIRFPDNLDEVVLTRRRGHKTVSGVAKEYPDILFDRRDLDFAIFSRVEE